MRALARSGAACLPLSERCLAADHAGARSAIHYAAKSGRNEVIKALLDHASSQPGRNTHPVFPNQNARWVPLLSHTAIS